MDVIDIYDQKGGRLRFRQLEERGKWVRVVREGSFVRVIGWIDRSELPKVEANGFLSKGQRKYSGRSQRWFEAVGRTCHGASRVCVAAGIPGPFVAVLEPSPGPPVRTALEAAALHWKLTSRQRQVLDLVTRGLTNVDTAGLLGIAESTVEFHLSAIFDKAGVDNRTTLIVRLQRLSD